MPAPSKDRKDRPHVPGRRPQVDETVERTSDQVDRAGVSRTGLPERLTSLRKPCAAVTRYLAPLWRSAGVPWAWGQRHVRTASEAAYRPHPLPCKAENRPRPDFFPATLAGGRKLPRKPREAQAETPAAGRIGRESTGTASASAVAPASAAEHVVRDAGIPGIGIGRLQPALLRQHAARGDAAGIRHLDEAA